MRAILAGVCGMVAWLLVAAPVPVHAWGMEAHRWLTQRALDGLPSELKPFFAVHRDFVIEHAVDPDLWRVAGLKSDLGDEDPNHFLDIDALDDVAPFRNVPRVRSEFVAKYGAERASRAGRLPWRAEEMYGRLVTMFQDAGKPAGPPYAADNARYLGAVLAHYIEDAYQPFHATANYDGQTSNQRGIHSRFETELVLRTRSTLTLAPVSIRPVGDIRDFVFEAVIQSEALVAPILHADRAAAAGREYYDDAYFVAFLTGTRPVLERRLSESSSAVASVIVRAWEQAGRPTLPINTGPRPPTKIRRGTGPQ